MKRKKRVTEKTTAANRNNGNKSSGPRTARGKNTTRFNGVKNGLFAKHLVIHQCDGEGCELEFENLRSGLQLELQPVGLLEEFYVESIAECMWKLRRAIVAEKGSVQNVSRWVDKPPNIRDLADPILQKLIIILKAQDDIETKRKLSPELEIVVFRILLDLALLPPDGDLDSLHASLEKCVKKLQLGIPICIRLDSERTEDYYTSHALPPEAAMGQILRYEKAARKTLDLTLLRLAESQRKRENTKIPLSD
jgi:hypothetical protein